MDHSLDVSFNHLQNIDRSLGENLDLLATEPAVLNGARRRTVATP